MNGIFRALSRFNYIRPVCSQLFFLIITTLPIIEKRMQQIPSKNTVARFFLKNNEDCSALSRAVFKIVYPAGNGPQHGHGLLGLMEIPALGINTVIVL